MAEAKQSDHSMNEWMYSPGPREGDFLQLQWMRASPQIQVERDPKNLAFALEPLSIDPMPWLPPAVFIPTLENKERVRTENDASAEIGEALDGDVEVILQDLIENLVRETSTQHAISRASTLTQEHWIAALDNVQSPLFPLSALQFSILLCGLEDATRDTDAVHGNRAIALAEALTRPDADALPRALRKHWPNNNEFGEKTLALPRCAPFQRGDAQRLARSLLRGTSLGSLSSRDFRSWISKAALRDRGGPAGAELETCIGELFFSSL
jgi:hypothetical protein